VAAWAALGSPPNPSPSQIQAIRARSELQTLSAKSPIAIIDGKTTLAFELPVNSVSLMVIEPG
jgi:beta-xylosidase